MKIDVIDARDERMPSLPPAEMAVIWDAHEAGRRRRYLRWVEFRRRVRPVAATITGLIVAGLIVAFLSHAFGWVR
ncbi:hypothetical protein [Streptacidiphilus sp. P02-A3a]|uniref:hypothetical protein n=1 Tax=Streptacidiphilus sp. P02-A3a TaxID=2704468 RepID=UPI0015FD9942|nr:hypothetical protein [Streptacidiphilus sp. P02-A3a]QMU72119.1 hypothetical protein GXP74_31660 [Streptacidiphilus sp. P02-A3a]